VGRSRSASKPEASVLAKELSQSKPFEALEVEAYLNLIRTGDQLEGNVARFLKQHGISAPQYNVLRILRGAGTDGLPSLSVASRMVTRVPDVTRLLDRIAAQGWVKRERSKVDGRVVIARITAKGLKLLARLDEPLVEFNREQLGHMKRAELEQLIGLLERARSQA
jgi:DNA-binding MarR family transcriptional regulator